MFWVKRRFASGDHALYADALERLIAQNPRRSREFIMVSTEVGNARDSDYFVGVPEKHFLVHFDGFDPVD
jgi:hypothetical protein